MRKGVSNHTGFTLIEVIATLVLVGILAAAAGIGIAKVAEGYVFARLNAETTQKAQVAIARIAKELSSATAITTAGGTTVGYTRPISPGSTTDVTNVIAFGANALTVQVGGAPAATLAGNVTAFSLTYLNAAGAVTTVPAAVRRVDFSITLSGAANTLMEFDNNTVFLKEFQ